MRDSDGMELFESYLRDVKRSSQNTISSYLRDIRQLSEYLHAHTDADLGSRKRKSCVNTSTGCAATASLLPRFPGQSHR